MDEARLLLDLMRDYLGISDPRDLTPSGLRSLLLDLYPRKITVLHREDAEDVVPTVRDMVRFVAESGEVALASDLSAQLDDIEADFLDGVMDPSRWGMARSFVQAMVEAGVDLDDDRAVQTWIAGYNAGVAGAADKHPYQSPFDAESDGPFDSAPDAAEIREAFGLPERLPPIRLPDEPALAETARAVPLIARAAQLARWADGKVLTAAGDLRTKDVVAAAALVGADMPAGVSRVYEVPGLRELWGLAGCAGLATVSEDGRRLEVDAAEAWPDGDDDEVLAIWSAAHSHVLGHALGEQDHSGDFDDLELDAPGVALTFGLLLAGADGMDIDEFRPMLRDLVTSGLDGAAQRRRWQDWTREHGDMADMLLGQLAELGAVTLEGNLARLTPLGLWDIRESIADVVEIPLLPPADQMSAADLVAFAREASVLDLDREKRSWLASRPGADAALQLLEEAKTGDVTARVIATSIASDIGVAAESVWRDALDDAALRPYAKVALARIADPDAGEPFDVPGLGRDEVASMASDSVVAMASGSDEADLPGIIREAVPGPEYEELFDLMRRSANPAAVEALALIGRHHPDKRVAKAARRASFRAVSSRPASRPSPR